MKEQRRLSRMLVGVILSLFTLCSCQNAVSMAHSAPSSSSHIGNQDRVFSAISTTSFSLSSTKEDLHTLLSVVPTSKLRHGHKEFTVEIVDKKQSLVIAFYGYSGPTLYTLSNRTNGGDIRIVLGSQYWDLALRPDLTCSLNIVSDIPTERAEFHRMRGTFSCSTLPAGQYNASPHPVTVAHGLFDVAIVVES